jgi:hypothetical protein
MQILTLFSTLPRQNHSYYINNYVFVNIVSHQKNYFKEIETIP